MQLDEYTTVAFAKTQIICQGARATRIGEGLLRQLRKYLTKTEFVKGNISENERKEMFKSISLTSIISYPDDVEKINTDCDIVFQIIFGEEKDNSVNLVQEKIKGIPFITFAIGKLGNETKNAAYIRLDESEILDTFIDYFSVYSFPQEFGADFEELRPIFEHKGEISTEKGEGFNLCVFRKSSADFALDNNIKSINQEKGRYVLVSRIANENSVKIYSI